MALLSVVSTVADVQLQDPYAEPSAEERSPQSQKEVSCEVVAELAWVICERKNYQHHLEAYLRYRLFCMAISGTWDRYFGNY